MGKFSPPRPRRRPRWPTDEIRWPGRAHYEPTVLAGQLRATDKSTLTSFSAASWISSGCDMSCATMR